MTKPRVRNLRVVLLCEFNFRKNLMPWFAGSKACEGELSWFDALESVIHSAESSPASQCKQV